VDIVFNDYIKYRAKLRRFDLDKVEYILRYSHEKYFDLETQRKIVVGKHDEIIIMIPYEIHEECLVPITIHATSRQQIKFRLKTGRFNYE